MTRLYGDDLIDRDTPADVLADLHAFAAPALVAGHLPEFGSWSWHRLAPDAPERTYAAIRGAMAYWTGRAIGPGVPQKVIDRAVSETLIEITTDVRAGFRGDRQRRRDALPGRIEPVIDYPITEGLFTLAGRTA